MELPTCRLAEWSPLADMDFLLAHQVLQDQDYADFFLNRPKGREVLLDNSYHELGYTLPIVDLMDAAERVNADYVIAPDDVNDPDFTIESFKTMRARFQDQDVPSKIAVVWTGFSNGSTYQEREAFLSHVQEADMLCCTFKLKQRFQYYYDSIRAKLWKRVHLLGVDSLEELKKWAAMDRHMRQQDFEVNWSVDTGKALKWALRGKKLDELKSLRTSEATTALGLPSEASQQLLKLESEILTPDVEEVFRHNVQVLKEACA